MKTKDLAPLFKRYALVEKGITPRVVKEIISITTKLSEHLKNPRVKSIQTNQIRDFLYQEKAKALWKNSTFINKRQYLKTFFTFCKSYGYISCNPVDEIAKPKLAKRLPRFLNKEQVRTMLVKLDCYDWYNLLELHRNRALVRTFLYTGIRLSELLNLKTYQINLLENQIFIEQGKGRKDRIIPIHPELKPFLLCYLNFKQPSLFVFTSIKSECPLTAKNLYRIFKVLVKECRFKVTPHMLRHTMARNCIESNINPFALQAILGHSDIATTQIYVTMSQNSIKEQFQKLEF